MRLYDIINVIFILKLFLFKPHYDPNSISYGKSQSVCGHEYMESEPSVVREAYRKSEYNTLGSLHRHIKSKHFLLTRGCILIVWNSHQSMGQHLTYK